MKNKVKYLNGSVQAVSYGLRFRSNRLKHSVKRFDRFGLATLVVIATEVLQKLKLRYLRGIVLHFRVNPAFSFHNFCSLFLLHSHTCSIMWSRTTYVSMFERFIDYLHTTHLGVEINFMPKEHHPSGTRGSSLASKGQYCFS